MPTILIADDDEHIAELIELYLEKDGIAVERAADGVAAWERIQRGGIDLAILDIMMPGMDGLEATRRIRANPRLRDLPVIAITAKAMRDDQDQCRRAGANDYMAKPIDLDRLLSLIRVWLPSLRRIGT